jgi:hypothetical protein
MLFADAEPLDQGLVATEIRALQVVEETTPLPNQHEQPTTGMVILPVKLEVLRQVRDAIREKCHLHFRRPRIGIMPPVCLYDLSRARLEHCHPALSVSVFSRSLRLVVEGYHATQHV